MMYSRCVPATSIVNRPLVRAAVELQPALGIGAPPEPALPAPPLVPPRPAAPMVPATPVVPPRPAVAFVPAAPVGPPAPIVPDEEPHPPASASSVRTANPTPIETPRLAVAHIGYLLSA